MNDQNPQTNASAAQNLTPAHIRSGIFPRAFPHAEPSNNPDPYLDDPATRTLLAFFHAKGLAALKDEDRREEWYADWLTYQKTHALYAQLLTPAEFSTQGGSFDLLRYARFLEVFAYCSPAHGYSLQVTFLGFFSILMGANPELKRQAVAALDAGGLLAFGVSEKDHGSDLLANEFSIVDAEAAGYVASGKKYYIGNSDVASIIATLGRRIPSDPAAAARVSRLPFMLVALRPGAGAALKSLGKIRTLGVRTANVGAFQADGYRLGPGDVIAEGRQAWDAVFGTVTLGKFFLGFGSIGICEHAWHEAATHLRRRILYGKPAIDMPHIRWAMAQAWTRLTAMKLYAYRALDYIHAASPADRRYLLFCAVQKARVSTEGLKVMALLQECIGARGFEGDTYFEMARRDAQLIPSLEGSMHINLELAVQFLPRYFDRSASAPAAPPSLAAGETLSRENPYLTQARTGATHAISFRPFLESYRPLVAIPNVILFARQAAALRRVIRHESVRRADNHSTQRTQIVGQCLATVAYGQLVAEGLVRLEMPRELTAAIFGLLAGDLSTWALQWAAMPEVDLAERAAISRMVRMPRTVASDWEEISRCASGGSSHRDGR